ncbi:MAG: hypothetical protein R2788_05000 [Saprospiraceae bacterium]
MAFVVLRPIWRRMPTIGSGTWTVVSGDGNGVFGVPTAQLPASTARQAKPIPYGGLFPMRHALSPRMKLT